MRQGLFVLFLAGCATAAAGAPPLAARQDIVLDTYIQNDLEACVQLVPGGISTERNLVLLDVRIEMRRSIGECGCKSAVFGYRVRLDDRDHSNVDATGRVNTLRRQLMFKEQAYLVLATDAAMLSQAKAAVIDVTCVDPQ